MQIIGRREKVDFPEFELCNLVAKIDTGAYTSSLHCSNIREIKKKSGEKYLTFKLLDPSHPQYSENKYKSKNYSQKMVKSSNGKSELRYVIVTEINIGNNKHKIALTLTNRQDMRYPVLLGRKLIKRIYIVDVSKLNLLKSKNII